MATPRRRLFQSLDARAYVLAILTLLYSLSGFDRSILWVMLEPIKLEFALSDAQLGWLSGFAFAAIYGTVGIPMGMLADRTVRTRLIALAAFVWSLATLFCAGAAGFWMLFLGRMIVGASESAAPPASVSVIADLYPRESRGTAMGIYLSATGLSLVAAFALGGWISDRYGWRTGFIVAGAPGLILSILALLTLREPPRSIAAPAKAPPLRATCGLLACSPAPRNILLALTACSIATVGISTFLTSLLVRSYQLGAGEAGLFSAWGFLVASAAVPLIGRFADLRSRQEPRWGSWSPAVLCVLAFLASIALSLWDSRLGLLLALPVLASASAAQVALAFTLLQELIPPHVRATTIASAYALQNMVGGGLGAVLVGALSDAFAAQGADSLRFAIGTIAMLFLVGGAFYACAARSIRLVGPGPAMAPSR